MEKTISEVLDKWFEEKQRGQLHPRTYRMRRTNDVFYVVDRDDLAEFMDFVEYNLSFVMSLHCKIDGDSIYFDTRDLSESPIFG